MTQYNERLTELRRQMSGKNRLEQLINKLKKQRQELADKVYDLEQIMEKEQADVEKLTHRSLAAFYYTVIGKKDAMLNKEQQEAYAARIKYDTALSELNAVETDIKKAEAELRSSRKSEQLYQQVLQEKTAFLKASGNSDADAILDFETQLTQLSSQQTELKEALSAGNTALHTVEKVLSLLDDADGLSTWDMLGGGVFVDIAKHDTLDQAQDLIEELQVQLRRFYTELADVSVQADVQVNIDGFTRFADYFFDGLFADWTVKDQISQSQQQVLQTRNQIGAVINQLNKLQANTEQEIKATKTRLDTYVYEH